MIQTIMVGADGSPGSRRAIEWATGRARELGSEVVAVLVVRPFGEFVMEMPPLPGNVLQSRRDALTNRWCKPLRDAGVKYRTLVMEDDPVRGLLEAADREHADLLVLGAHDHSSVVHRVMGSVTYAVAHRAECPVVIVPASTGSTSTVGERADSTPTYA